MKKNGRTVEKENGNSDKERALARAAARAEKKRRANESQDVPKVDRWNKK